MNIFNLDIQRLRKKGIDKKILNMIYEESNKIINKIQVDKICFIDDEDFSKLIKCKEKFFESLFIGDFRRNEELINERILDGDKSIKNLSNRIANKILIKRISCRIDNMIDEASDQFEISTLKDRKLFFCNLLTVLNDESFDSFIQNEQCS